MKIIFLDIDGVLNTIKQVMYLVNSKICNGYDAQFRFDPVAMKNLKEIADHSGAYIVISSTWRLGNGKWDKYGAYIQHLKTDDRHWNEMMRNFEEIGIKKKVIGVTPYIINDHYDHDERGIEIRKWMEQFKKVTKKTIENFVILDDDGDMCEFRETNWVKCLPYEGGITDEVKNKALKILCC
jgi:hypothetical protein